jgi:hypothetical protein
VALLAVATNAALMESSPIVTVNLWFDGPVMRERFVGLIGGPMHWVFDKSAIFGAAAGHLSIVSSGAHAIARLDNPELTRLATQQIVQALPEAATRRLVRSEHNHRNDVGRHPLRRNRAEGPEPPVVHHHAGAFGARGPVRPRRRPHAARARPD